MTSDSHSVAGRARPSALLAVMVSVATVTSILGLSVALFFNPLWIAFQQERAGVPAITGYSPAQVREVTGAILSDVILGPPEFAVEVNGRAVFGAAERAHMVDVSGVVRTFEMVVGLGALVLVLIVVANRRRDWVWRAIARGSGGLAIAGAVIGVAVVFVFDAAFLLFHLLFFPQGNFAFDPTTQRITQLFPGQLFTETSIALAAVGLVIAIMVTIVARDRARRLAA